VNTNEPFLPLMTVEGFRDWSCIGRTKIYEEINTGRLKTIKVGNRRLIPRAEALRWLDSYLAEANPAGEA
jgi:excisionase family DNA binding protein